jgi:hypothetical protein
VLLATSYHYDLWSWMIVKASTNPILFCSTLTLFASLITAVLVFRKKIVKWWSKRNFFHFFGKKSA